MTMLDEILDRVSKLDPKALDELKGYVIEQTGHLKFIPNPGPQTQAYYCEADVVLYGGQAGGGKSGLIVGLALQRHKRSLVMRRQFTDLGAIIEDCLEKYGSRKGFSGAAPAKLRTDDDRLIEFGAAKLPGDEQSWQGQAHDLLALDEATQFLESQVRYLMGWVRPGPGVPEDQKCQTILATNPPKSPAEGQWVKKWFGPWIDKTDPLYPTPAGKLLWRISDSEGVFHWVDGPEPVERDGQVFTPQSLTFIPARLEDNPFLKDVSSYRAQLDSLDKHLRAALRDGDWMIAVEDDEYQVIPTAWALAAQERWTRDPPKDVPMCAMGVDVARGGADKTIIQPRYDVWFDEPIAKAGKDTPTGPDVGALVLKYRQHEAKITIDMGGGYGGAVHDHLVGVLGGAADKALHPFNGANKSSSRTADRQKGFYNRRAEVWWKFREALDPGQPNGSPVMLPPNSEIIADLITPRFEDTANGIKIEGKKEIVKRLGRSPDYGDAVVMAWATGNNYTSHGRIWRDLTRRMTPPFKVKTSKYENRKRRSR